nr:LysR family transcriptional regulator [uncultured Ralstonia sp.]
MISLALFWRAVETRSLSKAAEQSHIALAAASRRIALLEHRYGVLLLHRSRQGVEPTAAGKALAFHAQLMMEQAERLQADMSDYAKGAKGQLRIQANTSAMTQFLAKDLSVFAARYPEVKLDLKERRSGDIAQAVREGKTDIGVVVDGPSREGLICYEYQRDRLVAIVPRGHALRGRRVAFSALAEYDFVGLDSSTAMWRLVADAAATEGLSLRLRMQVNSFEAVCKLVQAGMGVGVLPEIAASNFAKDMGLRLISLTDAWAERRMFVCVRDFAALPAIGRRLVEHLIGPHPQAEAPQVQANGT